MADNSKIEWFAATWNPVCGCTKVALSFNLDALTHPIHLLPEANGHR